MPSRSRAALIVASLALPAFGCWSGTGAPPGRLDPAVAQDPLRVSSLAAGAAHTCALRADGAVLCWGSNEHGQLGRDVAGRIGWEPARARDIDDAVQIAAISGVSCALRRTGGVRCWGSVRKGRLIAAREDLPGIAGARRGALGVLERELAPADHGAACARGAGVVARGHQITGVVEARHAPRRRARGAGITELLALARSPAGDLPGALQRAEVVVPGDDLDRATEARDERAVGAELAARDALDAAALEPAARLAARPDGADQTAHHGQLEGLREGRGGAEVSPARDASIARPRARRAL